jgi:hypothetical protein
MAGKIEANDTGHIYHIAPFNFLEGTLAFVLCIRKSQQKIR